MKLVLWRLQRQFPEKNNYTAVGRLWVTNVYLCPSGLSRHGGPCNYLHSECCNGEQSLQNHALGFIQRPNLLSRLFSANAPRFFYSHHTTGLIFSHQATWHFLCLLFPLSNTSKCSWPVSKNVARREWMETCFPQFFVCGNTFQSFFIVAQLEDVCFYSSFLYVAPNIA